MAYEALQLHALRDNVLQVSHPSLPSTPDTYLTTENAAGATSLTVRDNMAFANGDLILIGTFGDEQAEIKKVNGAVSAGTTLTTTHPVNTPIRKIIYDKIEVYGNTSASSSGATQLNSATAIDIDPTAPFTEYIMTAAEASTYTYFGARGIRSVATTYNGAFSDFIAAAGYSTDTVGFIIKAAFDAVGESVRPDGKFSRQWAYDQIFLGEQDVAKERKKWSWLQQFEYDMGNVSLGMRSMALPSDIDDANTPRAIQGLRIGTGENLLYITKSEYEGIFQNVAYTTVGTTYAAGANTIILTDSRDFQDAGAINVYNATNGIDNVSYTTNTRSTSTLTGVTQNDDGGTAGDHVWQGEPQGRPSRYTVYEGNVYFDAVPDEATTNLVGANVWLDYYKKVTRVNSDGDTLTVPDPYCIQLWLESMIKKAKAGGKLDEKDTSWINYLIRRKRLIDNESSGQGVYLVPSVLNDEYYD